MNSCPVEHDSLRLQQILEFLRAMVCLITKPVALFHFLYWFLSSKVVAENFIDAFRMKTMLEQVPIPLQPFPRGDLSAVVLLIDMFHNGHSGTSQTWRLVK